MIFWRDEAGERYIDEISRQIYTMCTELFQKIGGIITLIDIFYFFNKKRATSLVSATEISQACDRFQHLGLHA